MWKSSKCSLNCSLILPRYRASFKEFSTVIKAFSRAQTTNAGSITTPHRGLPQDAARTDCNKQTPVKKNPELEWHLDNEQEDEDETPRGSIDFTAKSLRRIFNNGSFTEGGRLYGGWWQGIPRDYRWHVRINRMNTVEADFSRSTSTWSTGLRAWDSLKVISTHWKYFCLKQ